MKEVVKNLSGQSNIINYSVKPDFTYYLNSKNTIRFGAQAILFTFKPGTCCYYIARWILLKSNISLDDQYGVEYAMHILIMNKNLTNRIYHCNMVYVGRFFNYMGKGTKYSYRDTIPNESKPLDKEEKIAQRRNY
jgi:hypothetical protein